MPTQSWPNPATELAGAVIEGANDSASTWT